MVSQCGGLESGHPSVAQYFLNRIVVSGSFSEFYSYFVQSFRRRMTTKLPTIACSELLLEIFSLRCCCAPGRFEVCELVQCAAPVFVTIKSCCSIVRVCHALEAPPFVA